MNERPLAKWNSYPIAKTDRPQRRTRRLTWWDDIERQEPLPLQHAVFLKRGASWNKKPKGYRLPSSKEISKSPKKKKLPPRGVESWFKPSIPICTLRAPAANGAGL